MRVREPVAEVLVLLLGRGRAIGVREALVDKEVVQRRASTSFGLLVLERRVCSFGVLWVSGRCPPVGACGGVGVVPLLALFLFPLSVVPVIGFFCLAPTLLPSAGAVHRR